MWKSRPETDLERELRAQRPQPGDDFVRSLSSLVQPTRTPRPVLPKIALVAAVTAALAVLLGAAGALGYARTSLHALGTGVSQVVSKPATGGISGRSSRTSTSTSAATVTGLHLGSTGTPFNWVEYSPQFPLCWNGQVIWVSVWAIPFWIWHGAEPVRFCGSSGG